MSHIVCRAFLVSTSLFYPIRRRKTCIHTTSGGNHKSFDGPIHNILAWEESDYRSSTQGALALGPRQFADSGDVVGFGSDTNIYTVTNRGIHIQLPLILRGTSAIAALCCRREDNLSSQLGIALDKIQPKSEVYRREDDPLESASHAWLKRFKLMEIYLVKEDD